MEQILFLRWSKPVLGRERQAMKLFEKSIEYYGTLQREGLIESFEPVLLSNHAGDLNGFITIRGEAKKLAEIRRRDTWINFSVEGGYCLEKFGIIEGFAGSQLMDVFARWSKLIE